MYDEFLPDTDARRHRGTSRFRPRGAAIAAAACLCSVLAACDSEPDSASASAEPKQLDYYTLILPYALPLDAAVYRGDDKIGTIVEQDERHVAMVQVPSGTVIEQDTSLSVVPSSSPCEGARIPLVYEDKSFGNPGYKQFKVPKSSWDRAVVFLHRDDASVKVQVGQADLSAHPDGKPINLFGFDCDQSRVVKIDGQVVGELDKASGKAKTKFWLVTSDPEQTYCNREHQYGVMGIGTPKAKTLSGARLYALQHNVDFWMSPPDESVTSKGEFGGSVSLRYSLQQGTCDELDKAASTPRNKSNKGRRKK